MMNEQESLDYQETFSIINRPKWHLIIRLIK